MDATQPGTHVPTTTTDGQEALSGFGLHANPRLFAPPPEEIGHVCSAYSTYSQWPPSPPMGQRLRTTALIATLCGITALSLVLLLPLENAPIPLTAATLASAAMGAWAYWINTTFHHFCSYVGTRGIARISRSGHSGRTTRELMLFQDATALFTVPEHYYEHQRYIRAARVCQEITFTWSGADGAPLFTINGTIQNDSGLPDTVSPFYFGRAAERSWTNHLLSQAEERFEQEGHVTFPLGRQGYLKLGRDTLTIHLGQGEERRHPLAEITGVFWDKHHLTITTDSGESPTFDPRKALHIPFALFPNLQLFSSLLEELSGIRALQVQPRGEEPVPSKDPLTGLPNPLQLQDRLAAAMSKARRANKMVALLVMNLEDIHAIYHSFGTEGGQEAIKETAQRVLKTIRKSDLASRLDAFEQAAMLDDLADEETAWMLASKMSALLVEPLIIEGVSVNLNPHIGLSIYPKDGETPEALIRNARRAVRHARRCHQPFCRMAGEESGITPPVPVTAADCTLP